MGFLSQRDRNSNSNTLLDGIGDRGTGNGNGREKRPPAKYWCNVGVNVPMVDEETGEVQDVFVSLGGIALDDLKPVPVKGSNANWRALAQAKNQLRENVLKLVTSFDPGTSEILPQLSVELRRAGEEEAALDESGDNKLANAINDVFAR